METVELASSRVRSVTICIFVEGSRLLAIRELWLVSAVVGSRAREEKPGWRVAVWERWCIIPRELRTSELDEAEWTARF